ncbi:hypothetical protein [Pseudorhodoferax sp.]|uniref:hypothetical protein n=1 Tax=Pseudorhodoferax sp. TaxID=1993553 RepID=UPI0039E65941
MSRQPAGRSADLAWKSGICIAIGLVVLLAPRFMGPTPLHDMIAQSSVVGWFALVLGLAFGVLYLRHR